MPMPSAFIFPTSVYGQLNDVYGLNITNYNSGANTTGFPAGAGMALGMFGLLFDGTMVRLLKSGSAVNANDACTVKLNLSNDYTVQTTSTKDTVPMTAISDRAGVALVSSDFAWFTVYGLATANVAAGVAAGAFLVSSASAGRLYAASAGVSFQSNIIMLNASVNAGAYPVKIL